MAVFGELRDQIVPADRRLDRDNLTARDGNIIGVISGFFGGGRAVGGPVSAGSSYLVGERGPELLTMGARSGTITPNHALGGASVSMAGPTIYIDSRSDQGQSTNQAIAP